MAFSDSRPPRLVLDSSICNTNQNCCIPERQCYPSVRDVLESFPLRHCSEPQHAATFDVKSAHKRIVLAEHHRGMVGFTFQGRIFFYKVCPFGATLSAFWWGRLGAWLVRTLHRLIWVQHGLWLFVDDFLLTQSQTVLPVFATVLAIFCRVFRIPLSWRKCTLGPMVDWIGWRFNFYNGIVSLHPAKQDKLIAQIEELLKHRQCTCKQQEKFTGLALWVTHLLPPFRALLHWLFSDLRSLPCYTLQCQPRLLDLGQILPGGRPQLLVYSTRNSHLTLNSSQFAIPLFRPCRKWNRSVSPTVVCGFALSTPSHNTESFQPTAEEC